VVSDCGWGIDFGVAFYECGFNDCVRKTENTKVNRLANITNTFECYQQFIRFYEENKDKWFEDIHIELRQWFAANMSATLGALLDLLAKGLNDFHFNYPPDIEKILSKNDFLTFYGKVREIDTYHTTIRFQKLTPTAGRYFKMYVIEELIGRTELPKMTDAVKEKIVESIYEMFVNAQTHSGTENIYTCGQVFPKRNTIEFTIVDTGIGIKEKVNEYLDMNLTSSKAIRWAIVNRHSTKDVTGGLGLALLKEFIEKNKGKMQIVSDSGFYEFGKNGEISREFQGRFPGTIVNLQFNTNDSGNYCLKDEIDINDIF